MRLFLGEKEYFSVEEYAYAIIKFAMDDEERHIFVHAYATDEDRIRMVNAIGGLVPYKPYSREQICAGVRYLGQYVSIGGGRRVPN